MSSFFGTAIAPLVGAGDRVSEDVGRALGTQDVVFHLGRGVDPVAAVVIAADVFRVFVDDGEMVPDIAVFGIGARLAAADAPAFQGGLSLMTQAMVSIPCTACSTMWSPESQQ